MNSPRELERSRAIGRSVPTARSSGTLKRVLFFTPDWAARLKSLKMRLVSRVANADHSPKMNVCDIFVHRAFIPLKIQFFVFKRLFWRHLWWPSMHLNVGKSWQVPVLCLHVEEIKNGQRSLFPKQICSSEQRGKKVAIFYGGNFRNKLCSVLSAERPLKRVVRTDL